MRRSAERDVREQPRPACRGVLAFRRPIGEYAMKVREQIRGGPRRELLSYTGLLSFFRQTKRIAIDDRTYTLEPINYRPPRGGNGFVLWATEEVTGDKCAIKLF